MLYVVITEPKMKYRQSYSIAIEFVEANTKTEAVKKAEAVKDTAFKSPRATEVRAGLYLWA